MGKQEFTWLQKILVFGWQNMAATFSASHPGLSMDPPCIRGHLRKMSNGVGSLSDANMSKKASYGMNEMYKS